VIPLGDAIHACGAEVVLRKQRETPLHVDDTEGDTGAAEQTTHTRHDRRPQIRLYASLVNISDQIVQGSRVRACALQVDLPLFELLPPPQDHPSLEKPSILLRLFGAAQSFV
jgi:hypothetical protein